MSVPCRVLLVDDEEDACVVLGDVLECYGCEVRTVCDPAEALRIGCSETFDLVVLDIRMPEIDGIEVLRRIRSRGHREIVMLTGFIDDDLEAKARQEGAGAVLHKPVDLDALLGRIDALRQANR
ncbi:MAG TPA: response regulator [Armatimonadetes bacterium]|jgi:CheY-like chemotaxis protein|nr:response regulator [Armatimonadota bacterium]